MVKSTANPVVIGPPVSNAGTINADTGTLGVTTTFQDGGAINVASAATYGNGGTTTLLGGTLAGTGRRLGDVTNSGRRARRVARRADRAGRLHPGRGRDAPAEGSTGSRRAPDTTASSRRTRRRSTGRWR